MMNELKDLLLKHGYEPNRFKSGDLHVHMESHLDSGSTLDEFLKRYAELGANTIILTDHGVITAYPDVYSKAKDYNIKIIPACELYIKDSLNRREHLIVIAPTIEKYKDLCKLCTESFTTTVNSGKVTIPITSMESLRKYGKGFIATSACMQGPLSMIIRQNDDIDKKIKTLAKKRGENPKSDTYLKQVERISFLENEISELKKETDEAKKTKSDKYEILSAQLTDKKVILKKLKKEVSDIEKEYASYESYSKQIKELEKEYVKDSDMETAILEKFKEFENIFGKNNFYVELQNHHIALETKIMKTLAKIAKKHDLRVICTNDVHMAKKEDVIKRQIMSSDRFARWNELSEGDNELYIKTPFELAECISEIAENDMVLNALENVHDICNKCNVVLPNEAHYPKFKTPNGETSEEYLRLLTYQGAKEKLGELSKEYRDRLEYELSIMINMGYADYHLIVQDFIRFGRALSKMPEERQNTLLKTMYSMSLKEMLSYIFEEQSNIGYYIGPGRGSAAGSLVTYCLGITNIDPIKNNLLFERFLNPERVSMPDIDTDIETFCRPILVEYLKKKYGEDSVCGIMTKAYAKGKSAIETYARVKESIAQDKSYYNTGDMIRKAYPDGLSLQECKDDLLDQFKGNSKACEIIENASKIEGQFLNYGLHAAGVIIADNHPVSDYVALMWDSNNAMFKTQCDMAYAESMGLLKFDLLGLRTLSIITETIRRIKKLHNITIDIENIPQELEVYKTIYSAGKTEAIFQVESSGMKEMLKNFKPSSFEDLTLLIAAYRPGPMAFIPDIIRSKHYGEKPEYAIKEMDEVLGVTYGYPIYQEQLMELFHRFANFTLGEADVVRRYMSKKKVDKFVAFKPKFIDGLIKNGAKSEKAEELWDSLVNFAKYGFNKSHAAAYATVSYQTAWLKYHYPKEFLVSVLNSFDAKKMIEKAPALIASFDSQIKISPPNINKSEKMFSLDEDGSIFFGLSCIKGAGEPTSYAISNRPYSSFSEFMLKGHNNKKTTHALIRAGAFDEFCSNRTALLIAYESYANILSKIATQTSKCAELEEKISIMENTKTEQVIDKLKEAGYTYKKIPKIDTFKKSLKETQKNVFDLKAELNNIILPISTPEDIRERLEIEKEHLGLYISANPLDEYKSALELGCVNINNVKKGSNIIMGLISNLRVVNRKSDGKNLAFFTLEDKTGKIDVNCFTKEYAVYSDFIKDGQVVIMMGNVEESKSDFSEEEDAVTYKITLKSIDILQPNKKPIVLHVQNLFEWTEIMDDVIKCYGIKSGHPLLIDNKAEDNIRTSHITVTQDILMSKKYFASFTE